VESGAQGVSRSTGKPSFHFHACPEFIALEARDNGMLGITLAQVAPTSKKSTRSHGKHKKAS
jgi:hypothetical protein